MDFTSPTYPYQRVMEGYSRFVGAEEIPRKILLYLLDLPDAAGYMPADDNTRPRVRLAKTLWHDGENPLAGALPSPEEKLSLLFDGNMPVLNTDEQKAVHPKGYRLYPLSYWIQAQALAATTIRCYLGRVIPSSPYMASIGLCFDILCNYGFENTTKTDAYSRSYNMEQCILEALHGVNMTGIGVVQFNRQAHMDNGSKSIYDEGNNVGRRLHMSIDWAESSAAADN